MENADINEKINDLYIVYRYNMNSINTTKYIMGIYTTRENAVNRQKEICPNYNKYLKIYTSGTGDVTFINKLRLGNSNIEMFTT